MSWWNERDGGNRPKNKWMGGEGSGGRGGGRNGDNDNPLKGNEFPNPQSAFVKMEQKVARSFEPGQVITPHDLGILGVSYLIMIANSSLRPDHFHLRWNDQQPIGNLELPGKSAMIDFLGIERFADIPKEARTTIMQRVMGHEGDRRDCVYAAALSAIESVRYHAYFAPTATNGLHVRLVYDSHAQPGYKGKMDVSHVDLRNMVSVWMKKPVK